LNLHCVRVDQVGSLAAPPELRAAIASFDRGQISAAALEGIIDREVRDSIARQEAIGMPVVTDGEYRRRNFQESFAASVSGFDAPQRVTVHDDLSISTQPFARAEQNFEARGPAILTRRPVMARLALERNVPLEEYRLAAAVARHPVKATLLSPDRISQRFAWEASRAIYPDMDAFMADVVAIGRQMIEQLVAAGCRYIQIDAPGYTAYADRVSLERMRARGEDPQRNLERSIAADNAMIAGFDGVTFGIHLCRGNPRTTDPATGKIVAQWHREGHYDAIAEQVFGGLAHDRFLLEYDSERAGGFEPLRHIPAGKVAVLGLVTTKDETIEPRQMLIDRIEAAARHLPLDQLAISPQCGFGGVDPINVTLSEAVQWQKFERLVEVAQAVWGEV
jgi:5-methyltetrahydropteroyltriglutamate--homocysteine methyltransferase